MEGLSISEKARNVALEALRGETRGNGHPFIEHPDAIAEIIRKEIGLSEVCVAAMYLHEATRLHSVVYTPTQIIGRNLQTICSEFDLSGDDLQGFWTGSLVTVEVPDFKGTPTMVTIGVNLLSERGVEIVPGDAYRWEKVVRQPIPEYSFGNDGCWINRNGVLSYVPDNEFTQDIIDAMERNAHANGIPVEELRESEQRPYHQESYQSEETRQLTR